jgi:membrane-bound lytic murein transglycosylase MltF
LVKQSQDSHCPEKWREHIKMLTPSAEGCYEAFLGDDYAEDDEDYHYYSVDEVRYYIRMALDNVAIKRPEQAQEVSDFIKRYAL